MNAAATAVAQQRLRDLTPRDGWRADEQTFAADYDCVQIDRIASMLAPCIDGVSSALRKYENVATTSDS